MSNKEKNNKTNQQIYNMIKSTKYVVLFYKNKYKIKEDIYKYKKLFINRVLTFLIVSSCSYRVHPFNYNVNRVDPFKTQTH